MDGPPIEVAIHDNMYLAAPISYVIVNGPSTSRHLLLHLEPEERAPKTNETTAAQLQLPEGSASWLEVCFIRFTSLMR